MSATHPQGALAGIRARLDEALLRLRSVADRAIPLREVERLIAAALVHVYRALEATGDYGEFHEALNQALHHARGAQELLGQIETDDGAAARELVFVAQIVRDLRRVEPEPRGEPGARPSRSPSPPRVVRASTRVPTLVHLLAGRVFPAVPLPNVEDVAEIAVEDPADRELLPTTLDDMLARALAAADAADLDPGGAASSSPAATTTGASTLGPPDDEELEREYVGVQLAELDVLLQRATVCFEELAMLGAMRRPLDGQGWAGREKAERRLLARIDAIVACGAWVLPKLVKLLEDRPLPDPEMTWAAIYLFGSIAGADALDQALRIARAAPLDVAPVRLAVVDALALIPHPGTEEALRGWLDDPQPAMRAVAVAVLARRRVVTLWAALHATHDTDSRVAVAGATAIATAEGTLTVQEVEAALHDPRDEVSGAAMASAILRRLEAGGRRALALLAEGRADCGGAGCLAAVTGRRAPVLEALRAALEGECSPALVRAVGWFGDPSLVDRLLRLVRTGNQSMRYAAVEALQRITGAGVSDSMPDPHYAEEDQPFERPYRIPAAVAELSLSADIWSAWWKTHGGRAKDGARYRFGNVWSPRDPLWELESPESPPTERRLAHLELVARTGKALPLDTDAFVWEQEQQLRAWRAELQPALSTAPPADGWAVHWAR